jgi:signal transduction histidine kinase
MGLGLLSAAPLYLSLAVQQGSEKARFPWSQLLSQMLDWYLWLLVLPLIWWIARRFPFDRRRFLSWLVINLILGVAVASLYGILSLAKNALITNYGVKDFFSLGVLERWPTYLLTSIGNFLIVYFAIVAGMHAVRYYQKYHRRELKTSQLKMQLAEAKLDALRMQLHPHFLFNALNAISSLMRSDPDAADGMISRLSDLLRLSLDHDDRHVIPLREELAFLDRYVGIELMRFRDRLVVDIEVTPECLDAQVPKLILQPLVENAIRHGIAHRASGGRVVVRGQRIDDGLRLQVVDDGPGLLAKDRPLREGVGLSNTRARLVQLYGPSHRFVPGNTTQGGFEVVLEIPFEREGRVLSGVFQRPTAA